MSDIQSWRNVDLEADEDDIEPRARNSRELEVLGPNCVPAWTNLTYVNTLCGRCQNTLQMLDQPQTWKRPRNEDFAIWSEEKGPTISQVRNAAHKGCHFCTLILSQLLIGRENLRLGAGHGLGFNRQEQDMLYENDRVWLQFSRSGSKTSHLTGGVRIWCAEGDRIAPELENNVGIWNLMTSRRRQEELFGDSSTDIKEYSHYLALFGFQVLKKSSKGRDDEVLVRALPTKQNEMDQISVTSSAEEIALYWLTECLNHHECGSPGQLPLLPTRVIDVRGHGGKGEPFLFETKGIRGKYVTLSYRWGECRQFQTTLDFIEEWKKSIPLAWMPHTFRDIIKLTRALDIPYLWIDALCIVQDSIEDCLREMGSMAEIYTNSSLTIAAVGSCNADDGCSPCRNKLAMADCYVSESVVISRTRPSQYALLTFGSIHNRAWCFQETELAPRLLSCGANELFWQCAKVVRRESEPTTTFDPNNKPFRIADERDDSNRRSSMSSRPWPIHGRLFDQKAISDPLQAYRHWYRLLEEYNERLLTFPADKLVAISALAIRFMDIVERPEDRPRPEEYCCGLWRRDILRGLLWNCPSRLKGPRVPFRGPSWSWVASEDTTTNCYSARHTECPEQSFYSEVLDVSVEVVSHLNPFGAVKSGKLSIFGPVAALPEEVYERRRDRLLHNIVANRFAKDARRYGVGAVENSESEAGSVEEDKDLISLVTSGVESATRNRLEVGAGSEILEAQDRIFADSKSEAEATAKEIEEERNKSGSNSSSGSKSGSVHTSEERCRQERREARSRSGESDSDRSSSNRSSSSSRSGGGSKSTNPWRKIPRLIFWDMDDPPTMDCKCLRVTRDLGLILSPVRKPGSISTHTARGAAGGIFQRVGLINVDEEGDVKKGRRSAKNEFYNLEWTSDVVTII